MKLRVFILGACSAAALLTGCAELSGSTALVSNAIDAGNDYPLRPEEDLGRGFLCCNMRTDGAWISDSNYEDKNKSMIPFGSPARFKGYGKYRFHLEINGIRQTIGNDYSRDMAMEAFAKRYFWKEDPRKKLASASPKVRSAVESARLTYGMTREQVVMSVGYPITSENPDYNAKVWKYWLGSNTPFEVHFDSDGLVNKLVGERLTLSRLYLR